MGAKGRGWGEDQGNRGKKGIGRGGGGGQENKEGRVGVRVYPAICT